MRKNNEPEATQERDRAEESYDEQLEEYQHSNDPERVQIKNAQIGLHNLSDNLHALCRGSELVIGDLRRFYDQFCRLLNINAYYKGKEAETLIQSLDEFYTHLTYLEELQERDTESRREDAKSGRPARSLGICLDCLMVLSDAIGRGFRYMIEDSDYLDYVDIGRSINEKKPYGL